MKNKKNLSKAIFLTLLLGVGISALFIGVSASAQTVVSSTNLIANPSLEIKKGNLPQGWKKSMNFLNRTVFTYPVAGYNSLKAAKVEITRYSTGNAEWYFDYVPVTAGKTYDFSDNYLSNTTSSIMVIYRLPNGILNNVKIATLPAAASWQQAQITFTVPAGVKSLTIFHLLDRVGWLTVDNYSLSATPVTPTPTYTLNVSTAGQGTVAKNPDLSSYISGTVVALTAAANAGWKFDNWSGDLTGTSNPANITMNSNKSVTANFSLIPTPPTTNLIINPSLEISDAANTYPLNWNKDGWGTNQPVFTYPVAGHNSDKAAKVEMLTYTDGDAKWYFDNVQVTPGATYEFSDYYISNVQSTITYRFTLSNGSYLYDDIAYPSSSATWQNAKGTFQAPPNAASVTLFHLINSVGFLTVDDFSLTQIPAVGILPQGMVSLDFDDGWLSAYENAIPILNWAGFKSTQYIFSDALTYPVEDGYVNADQVINMQTMGHEIGSHSKTHSDLTTLSPTDLISEIAGSKQDLLNIGVTNVSSFAYPFGQTNNTVKNAIKNAGYTSTRGVEFGLNNKTTDHYQLFAKAVVRNTTVDTVKSWIDEAVLNKTWLILYFHQIDISNLPYGTSPQNLQQIVNYLIANNVKVVTSSEGIQILSQP
jgi:peptidoglycan/xylan/chitin deacetylase (PgdA/CDA1 family)